MIPVKDDKQEYRALDKAAFAEEVKAAIRHVDTAGEIEDHLPDVDLPHGWSGAATPGDDAGGTPGDAAGESGDPGSVPGG